ncbi:uncharacterized protein FOMMEDRAFT_156100 [Fomitiporia mediterranea MF3/22]|uniref:uncharacterized protein n=1 Tax=Fomitiporia mediterranea (strain MF3/22) TaxID=694068 RepID=UPI0004409CA4|nr:uncharacterized protein FOMMEDRAFT_156100 [Fomitiporia mediterranea MF3/22]EJD02766.1 hypothetical protein FOMMEDRAFT_156100 [Fomitiporia mediterranea MF3/22]
MSHSLPYSIPYITAPAPQYMLPTHPHQTHIPGAVHMVSPAQIRTEQPQRKRPKYTRSKTGCLTCRAKKIKCDEGKPNCHRCEHAHRECTWPDPTTIKKKVQPRKTSTTQDNMSASEAASRSSGSPASRDATPSTRDIDGTVNPTAMTEPDRRYSGSQGYPYVESNAPMNRRQTNGGYNATSEVTPMSSGTTIPSYSYDFHPSPNGSISSRSNSRPSTGNSLPPSHFGASANHAAMESRDYPRWETMPTHRADASYAYYSTT